MEDVSLKIRKHYFIGGLKSTWKMICASNDQIKPIQYYDYYRLLQKAFYSSHLLSRWRILYYCVSDGVDACIVPLVINDKKKMVRGLSNFRRLDYEDVISSTSDLRFVYQCVRMVFEKYKDYSIHIEYVNEDSFLFRMFYSKMSCCEQCVSIDLKDDYGCYFAGVSKHQRQNIRTAYNRVMKEEFNIQIQCFDENHRIPKRVWKQCLQIYERRHAIEGTRLKKWIERQKNAYTHILNSVEGWRIFVLFHDETPISYMAGLYSERQKCYYVPRLCINIDYSQYSPGIVLIIETIQILIGQGVRSLDLMNGGEPYKIAMGGRVHNNYVLRCLVSELL